MKQPVLLQSILTTLSRTFSRRRVPSDPAEFRALFDRFKSVLESNNKALETITDMGETLGGDYLFDIVYVKKAYSYLRRDMEQSLRIFSELTQNRYPLLDQVFAHIDSLILNMVDEAPRDAGNPVLFFDEIPWDAAQVVGGKVAHLAEVKNRLHLRVPDGFVITTSAFDEFVRSNNLESRIEQLKQGGPTALQLRELRNQIVHGAMPPGVSRSIQKALAAIAERHPRPYLALRSSAQEEDSGLSFAGQFETILNVPPEQEAVEQAYRRVLASLFSEKAVAYQQQIGYELGSLKMAVGCMVMVDAVSSGVIFSTMTDGDKDTLIINAAWGLGEAIVEGRTEADRYILQKAAEPVVTIITPGKKECMVKSSTQGGTEEVRTPDLLRDRGSLTLEQAVELARQAMVIEKYFGSPRDIEWAIDTTGSVSILQARPLNIQPEDQIAANNNVDVHASAAAQYPLVVKDQGLVVQRGTGAGKVYIVKKPADIMSLPKGAVLVATNDSSLFVAAMPYVSAIITETGSQTSHMATICRELRIPAIVNLPKATELMKAGQEVTVVAGDGNRSKIYNGIVRELLREARQDKPRMEKVFEFRKKRYLLRYISPLHLIDPLMEEFSPGRCRTMHDILRFMHEKSVAELVDNAREGSAKLRKRGAIVRLELPVPAGILVMDMGGGLEQGVTEGKASFDRITSIPFKAIMHGMIHPGAWHSEAVPLKAKDFLSSMMRMPDITNAVDSTAGYNVAFISREYVNMSIRFGYHFNMVDCYCSENSRNNHIYFRFAGGATDLTKRSRRLDLIARIMEEYGFSIKIKGDLLNARVAGLDRGRMEQVLDQTGRLIAYARQLDAVLHDDYAVDRYVRLFLDGIYELVVPEDKRKGASA